MAQRMAFSWLHELCGAWIVLVHVAAGLFSLAVAIVYTTVLRTLVLSYTITQVDADILDYFGATIVISLGIVAGHVLLIAHILLGSRVDRITCWRPTTVGSSSPIAVAPAHSAALKLKSTFVRMSSWSARRTGFDKKQPMLKRWWTTYTPEITRLRMLGEVALQKANKTSQLVASVAINRLMALVIVLNCWLSPAVHYAMHGRSGITTRLVRLVLDACLDVVYSIVIPAAIFLPYYRAYTGGPEMFDPTLYYMDTWYANALSEMRQVFVTSWIDLVSKTSGLLALVYRLTIVQVALTTARKTLPRTVASLPSKRPRYTGWVCKVLDTILVVSGITVLVLHVQASGIAVSQRHDDHRGCLLEMHPWGATSYSCACLEISCSQHSMLGERPRLQAILEGVDPQSVQVLILSNCPALHVPPAIQQLENVMMIKLYNSTIVSWDQAAALRQRFHPSLQVLYLARVNMSSFPTGLLDSDFPLQLWDIEFCITNLTTLPEIVSEAWQRAMYVLLEGNPAMTEIPASLLQLPILDSLFLGVNGIQSVPDHILANASFLQLSLHHNPMQALPESVGSFEELLFVGVRGTNIRNLPPAWLSAASVWKHQVMVVATGTPFCKDLLVHGAANSGTTTEEGLTIFEMDWFLIDCFSKAMPSDLFMYPIADEDEWRRENQ